MNEYAIKEEIIKSVDSIKHKIKNMQDNDHITNLNLNKILKPVTKPLEALVQNNQSKLSVSKYPYFKEQKRSRNSSITSSIYPDFENDDVNTSFNNIYEPKQEECAQNIEKSYVNDSVNINNVIGSNLTDNINVPFGVRCENNSLMIGNSYVKFSQIINSLNKENMSFVTIDNNKYELTPGLKELLLSKKPDLSILSCEDKKIYKDILNYTNAHKRDYKPLAQIKGDKSSKYRRIIKPLFSNDTNLNESSKLGGMIPKLKKYKENTDLIYWDDPNELIDRLKLLMASKTAGNNNHDNEIISIIEELQEADIIK